MALAEKGVTLGHTPQSFEFSTLGGWIAHRGAGQQIQPLRQSGGLAYRCDACDAGGMLVTDFITGRRLQGPGLVDLIAGFQKESSASSPMQLSAFRAMPEQVEDRAWLFRDFESGINRDPPPVQNEIPVLHAAIVRCRRNSFLSGTLRYRRRALSVPVSLEKISRPARHGRPRGCAHREFRRAARTVSASTRSRFAAIASQTGRDRACRGPGRSWREGALPRALSARSDAGPRTWPSTRSKRQATWAKLTGLHAAVREGAREGCGRNRPLSISARHRDVSSEPFLSGDGASLLLHLHLSTRAGRRVRAVARDQEWPRPTPSWKTEAHSATTMGLAKITFPGWCAKKEKLGLDVLRAIKRALRSRGHSQSGETYPVLTAVFTASAASRSALPACGSTP